MSMKYSHAGRVGSEPIRPLPASALLLSPQHRCVIRRSCGSKWRRGECKEAIIRIRTILIAGTDRATAGPLRTDTVVGDYTADRRER